MLVGAAHTQAAALIISTNNTPLDRQALQKLSEEAFSRIGLPVQLVSLPSERSLHAANAGDVDGEGLRVAGLSEQYPNLIQVPERYISISFVAFARDASIRLDQSWASLAAYRVSFITGWKLFEAQASQARTITKVDTPEQMFRMLDSGRVDLALYTLADGQALVRREAMMSVAALSPSLKDVDMYLYLNQRHAALVPRLAKALRDMKADGTYNRIMNSLMAK
jgi:polar amino acid transport system substrate-binding protein